MVIFWAKVKSITFNDKLLWLLFGNFWKKLGFFLIQRLVTLELQLKPRYIFALAVPEHPLSREHSH